MAMLSAYLIAASAIIVFCLGTLHLVLTFRGNKFWPRDKTLKTTLESAPIHLTPQTTFWKAWICFNATHSLGAMFFGTIYVYRSLFAAAFCLLCFAIQAGSFLFSCVFSDYGTDFLAQIPR